MVRRFIGFELGFQCSKNRHPHYLPYKSYYSAIIPLDQRAQTKNLNFETSLCLPTMTMDAKPTTAPRDKRRPRRGTSLADLREHRFALSHSIPAGPHTLLVFSSPLPEEVPIRRDKNTASTKPQCRLPQRNIGRK